MGPLGSGLKYQTSLHRGWPLQKLYTGFRWWPFPCLRRSDLRPALWSCGVLTTNPVVLGLNPKMSGVILEQATLTSTCSWLHGSAFSTSLFGLKLVCRTNSFLFPFLFSLFPFQVRLVSAQTRWSLSVHKQPSAPTSKRSFMTHFQVVFYGYLFM